MAKRAIPKDKILRFNFNDLSVQIPTVPLVDPDGGGGAFGLMVPPKLP